MADATAGVLVLFEALVANGTLSPALAQVTLEHLMPHLSAKQRQRAHDQLQRLLEDDDGALPPNSPSAPLPGLPGNPSR